ncbi:hypothetical protein D3C87_1222510 [compost metagenome]
MLRVGTNADRVDFHAFLGRQARGGQRVDFATVVGAVSHQNQHATLRRALSQAFEAQANRVANGGVLAGDADARFIEPDAHGVPVEGQRRLQVGLAAEQDQADPITLAAFEEVTEQILHQRQAADVFALPLHVGEIHRAGHVHRHQQIAATGGNRQRFAEPLRACGGSQQHQPQQQERCLLAPGRQVGPGAASGQAFEVAEETDLERRFATVGYRQHEAHQPRQRQEDEDPRPGELKHVCESRYRPLGSGRQSPCRRVCIRVCRRLPPAPSSASGRRPGSGCRGRPAICVH